MVKLSYLESFKVYKTVPPIIMPETPSKLKKGQAYIVWAPSVKSELQFLSSDKIIRFRHLYKYFIEKIWTMHLYGQAQKIVKPNGEGQISALLSEYRTGNLAQIDEVTSFKQDYKADLLKSFNVLVEVNHVFEAFFSNPKDNRAWKIRVNDLIKELKRVCDIDYIGAYGKNIIIPMQLWFTEEDYSNPAGLFLPTCKNPMGHVLRMLCNPDVLSSFGCNINLIDGEYVLRLNPNVVLGNDAIKDVFGFTKDVIISYIKKARKRNNVTIYPDDDEPVDGVEDDKNLQSLHAAEKQTEEEIRAEEIIIAMKGDPDKADKDAVIKNVVQRAKKAPAREKAQAPAKSTQKTTTAKADTPIPDTPDLSAPEDDAADQLAQISAEVKDISLPDQKAVDTVLAAQMSGRSVASQKRNEMLKERYKDLSFGETPLVDLIDVESDIEIPEVPVLARTINPRLKKISGQRFEEAYNQELMQHDLASILMHFSGVHPAMYINKNIEINDVSTRTDRVLRYTVTFEDEDRKRHRFSFKLPKMYNDKYLFLNGQELNITHQKLPFPITKVQPDRCQLVTNYNKIFVYRYGAALSPRMVKLKKYLSTAGPDKGISIRKGDCTGLNNGYLTTIEFDELAGTFVRIVIGKLNDNITFMFDPDQTGAMFAGVNKPDKVRSVSADGKETYEADDTLIPLAVWRKTKTMPLYYWISGRTNIVYCGLGPVGELSEFMTAAIGQYNPEAQKELEATSAGTKFIYSRARIMSQDIPLILVAGAADPGGLTAVLEKSGIKWDFVDKRPSVDKSITGVVPFADGYLTYDRYPYENSLLMNGLASFPSKEYNFHDMDTRDAYVDIFDLMCGQRTLADNLPAFYYMMVDPITKDVLNRLNMPTDFTKLLLFCNGVLADNSFQIDSVYENSRIRSNEIIMAHLYRELAVAWSNYRSGRTDTFSIPEDVIIKLLLTSKIVDPKSKLNISLELESDRNVKLKGPSGMNEDHSFTIEKRAYHPTMRGIVATNSTPSGEVGINRHLVTNPGILDARGFITVDKDDYDGTELLSPGEMLQPFGADSADIERLCMSISQSKHLVPVQSQCSSPISFDMERVAPYMSHDFAFQAKKDGKVVEITEDLMIVQYSDGTYDDIDLSEHPARNTDGGFYIMNRMDTKLKVGSKFKAGEILAFDKKTINDNDFFGDPCANVGTLARVSFESNGSVFEDSGYITDTFAHRFATKITKQKRVILSKYANIKYIAKVGQAVQANDPILAFDDTEDEFSSQLLASIADQTADEDEIIATSAPIVSKYTGVIKDITITYTVPLEEMSPSLRKVVEDYTKMANKREKVLAKYIDVRDANTIVKSSEMAVPDSQGKVAGTKIGEGVMIDFNIEYEDVAGNGDKGSITALKFTICNVIPAELAGYTESNPDRKIDVGVASFGAFKRMVADVEKIGILTKVLVEEKRRMKSTYGQRVKDEIKKLKGRK